LVYQKPEAVIETGVLVKPLDEAVIVNVPLSFEVAIAVTTPADTVAINVLLESQVATEVTSCPPLQLAVKGRVGRLGVRVPLVGLITGALVQATETVMG
jgi:hypothetical protein